MSNTASKSGTSKSQSSRRRALNSSEESQKVPTVSIDTTEFYRSGAPNPLPALPLESELVESNNQVYARYGPLQSSIRSALKNADLKVFEVHLMYRFILGESPTQNDITLVMTITRDQQRDNLTLAVNEVLGVLFKAQILNIRVEAIDPRAHQYFFVPTVPTSFLTTIWGALQRKVIEILGRTDYRWCSLTILNRGQEESQSEPVVVIGARPSASLEWKSHVRSQVLELLESNKVSMDVVFVREPVSSAGLSHTNSRPLKEFSGPVVMGSSIGMEDNSGTLGGYLTLVDPKNRRRVFGVTNHHVVFSDKTIKDAEEAKKSEMELLGVRKRGAFPWKVNSPSLADKDATIRDLDSRIEHHRNEIDGHTTTNPDTQEETFHDGLKQKIQRAEWKGSDTAYLEARVRKHERDEEADMKTKDKLQKGTDLEFATVFASSGRGQFGERDEDGHRKAMDWALLDCLKSRLGDNTMPSSERFEAATGAREPQPAKGKDPLMGYVWGGKTLVPQATKLGAHETCYAYTRAGHKIGKFSKVDVVDHMDNDPETYLAGVVVGGKEGFMQAGDSGCWVLNEDGQLEALGFAASPQNFFGYVIPIQDVYEDIEKTLGAKIVDPEWI